AAGAPGGLGAAGAGGDSTAFGGGGGGGGLYGGGGGGGADPYGSGGGGGGSSFTAPSVGGASTGIDTTGIPSITISYQDPGGNPGGGNPGGGGGGADGTPPSFVGSAKADPSTFAVDSKGTKETAVKSAAKKKPKKGTTFRYTLSEAARVVFTIERRGKGRKVGKTCKPQTASNRKRKACTRYTRVGAFAQQAHAGRNTKKFSGRIGKTKLSPGSYRATLLATDAAGNRSKTKQVTFKVVKP
ncbi:MAG: hypothetical protein ACJ8H8_19550, partial [Geminicoccaceae bacterium]